MIESDIRPGFKVVEYKYTDKLSAIQLLNFIRDRGIILDRPFFVIRPLNRAVDLFYQESSNNV